MKTILTIILVLIGIVSWGQSAKVRYAEQLIHGEYENYFDQWYYEYDSAANLKSIVWYADGAYLSTYNYEHDTLVNTHWSDGDSYYVYNTDSVYYWDMYNGNQLIRQIYQLDSLGQVYEEYAPGGVNNYRSYEWEDGNCTKVHIDLGSVIYTDSIIYYSDYLNPFYIQNESIRTGVPGPFYNGSVNFLHEVYHGTGGHTEFRVLESTGPYPTHIDYGELYNEDYIIIEYFDIIYGTTEIPSEPYTVLRVDYYDMMGRGIKKPTKGFYIERKTTDKGVISKKCFIQ